MSFRDLSLFCFPHVTTEGHTAARSCWHFYMHAPLLSKFHIEIVCVCSLLMLHAILS